MITLTNSQCNSIATYTVIGLETIALQQVQDRDNAKSKHLKMYIYRRLDVSPSMCKVSFTLLTMHPHIMKYCVQA